MSKPKINKIVIEVGGKKLEFTPEEAKELKSLLADLFGGTTTNTVYVDRYVPPRWNWPTYYCGTTLTTTAPEIYRSNVWCGTYDNQSLTLSTTRSK